MTVSRLTNRTQRPTEADMLDAIGWPDMWLDLRQMLEQGYGSTPETVFAGIDLGWALRFQQARRTLCSLFPERDAFTVLVVLNRDEAEQALAMLSAFHAPVQKLLREETHPRRGCWLWIRVQNQDDVEDVKRLLRLKSPASRASLRAA